MPRESNFFEEAMTLCQDSDPNVSRLAEAIYRAMLEENQHRNRSPQRSFNILYFVQTVVRAWLSERPGVGLKADTGFLQECESISGVNWPRIETFGNPIANRFVNLVKADSDSKGDEFDVAYAVKIIELLFGDDGELRCRNSGEMNAEEFDYWLSGFNGEQP
ncbi:hypothetical protein [Bremerella cremea]|uniref:hypothetical protein n=1 Tax=Bremerella cremea TaxID=1031537 RepID=UPI0031E79E6D